MLDDAFRTLIDHVALAQRILPNLARDDIHKDGEPSAMILAMDKAMEANGTLTRAYHDNVNATIAMLIEDTPAIQAFMKLLRSKARLEATAAEILEMIEPFVAGPKDARFPRAPKAMAGILRRFAPFLTNVKMEFDARTGKNRDRIIVASIETTSVGKPKGTGASPSRPIKPSGGAGSVEQPSLL